MQVDPIGFSGDDINLYRYCANNSLAWLDPFGLDIRKVSCEGKTVKVDDSKITPEDVDQEIQGMETTIGLLDKVINEGATFKELDLGPVANAATGADPRYGSDAQQYLRKTFEDNFKLSGDGLSEGAARGVFSQQGDVLKADTPSLGMSRMAANAQRRAQAYLNYVKKVKGTVYGSKSNQ